MPSTLKVIAVNLFSKISAGLRKTSKVVGEVFTGRVIDAATLEDLHDALILTDMGTATARTLMIELEEASRGNSFTGEQAKEWLKAAITKRLQAHAQPFELRGNPCVVLVVGVNGNGKTTTIGKLTANFMAQGKRVGIIAADVFRAAAVEQLQVWATRAAAKFYSGEANADPASVVFAGLERAVGEGCDVVLIDTAGRLHTKQNLMDELSKMRRVMQKIIPDAPHHTLLVLDATTGQNALAQAKAFHETAGITGLVITKLDGTAKAGVVVALAEHMKLPVHYIGVGEGVDDLLPFDAEGFAAGLVGA